MSGQGNFPISSIWPTVCGLIKETSWGTQSATGLKTILEDWFFEGAPPLYYGILKRWTGSAWIKEPLKVFGGSWQSKRLKRWNGTGWKEIDTTGQ